MRPCRTGGGGSHVSRLNFKLLVSVFIDACRLFVGRLSLVAISFYALLLLFGPCRLSECFFYGNNLTSRVTSFTYAYLPVNNTY